MADPWYPLKSIDPPGTEVVNSEVADGAHLRDVNHFEARWNWEIEWKSEAVGYV